MSDLQQKRCRIADQRLLTDSKVPATSGDTRAGPADTLFKSSESRRRAPPPKLRLISAEESSV